MRVGHGQLAHQAVQSGLQHGTDVAPHAQMAGKDKFNAGMRRARCGKSRRQFHLDVPGSVENERHDHHPASALRCLLKTIGDEHVGVFDETDDDAPIGMALTPERGEFFDLVVTRAFARTVADKENRRCLCFSHGKSP